METTFETVSNKGERVLTEDAGTRPALFRAHLERYIFALREIASTDRVLDCACGSGYGSDHLATKAREVVGVDLSPVAIEYCEKNYSRPNLKFLIGSAEALPFPDASFDVFCSIETIEHIPHPEKLIQEARRILKPGGKFIVSTPNRVNSGLASEERPENPFHLFEWSLSEFDEALEKDFPTRHYFGQRIRGKNKFHPLYVRSKLNRAFRKPDLIRLHQPELLMERLETRESWYPEVFVAVCTSPA